MVDPNVPPIITMFDNPNLQASDHPMVTVEEEHAAIVRTMVEQQVAHIPRGYYIQVPDQWWVCFWKMPLSLPSVSGAVGYLEERQKAHICFFFSKEEARRLVRLQKSYDAKTIREFDQNVDRSTLPERSTKPTVELTGPMAALLCGGQSILTGQAGVRLIPKQSRGDA